MKQPSRHQTRFVSVQAVIQGIMTDFTKPLSEYLQTATIKIDENFCAQIYDIVQKHGEFLSQILTNHIKTKPFHLFNTALKAIFFCALAELYYIHTDKKIVINEYILITKRLIGDTSYKLVNAVLDGLKENTMNQQNTI